MADLNTTERTQTVAFDEVYASLRGRASSRGFGSLTSPEQTFYAIAVLRSDLALGAFQLFFDCASDPVKRFVGKALDDLGRPELADIVDQAYILWEADAAWKAEVDAETGGVPPNEARLAALTDRFLEEDDDLAQRLTRWAQARRLAPR